MTRALFWAGIAALVLVFAAAMSDYGRHHRGQPECPAPVCEAS